MNDPIPALDPSRFPNLTGAERPFFEFWWTRVTDPRDPQRLRWAEYEERMVEMRAEYADALEKAISLEGARVLDVGCQNGATLVALARRGARPSGIEICPRSAEAAAVRLGCHGVEADVRVGSATRMPYESGSFDAVVASNVVEHVDDPPALIRECARVLTPGGVLYLDGPNRFAPKLLLSDPHYQLAGVSILPGWLARAYVTKLRGFPAYEAETFPIAWRTFRQLEEAGLDVLSEDGPAWAPRRARWLAASLKPLFRVLAKKRPVH